MFIGLSLFHHYLQINLHRHLGILDMVMEILSSKIYSYIIEKQMVVSANQVVFLKVFKFSVGQSHVTISGIKTWK